MIYEWDPQKATANLDKHGVGFAEASSVFLDPLAVTFADPDHSLGEARFITLGQSAEGLVLVVSHLELGDDQIRIISARRATKRERHEYQEAEG